MEFAKFAKWLKYSRARSQFLEFGESLDFRQIWDFKIPLKNIANNGVVVKYLKYKQWHRVRFAIMFFPSHSLLLLQ